MSKEAIEYLEAEVDRAVDYVRKEFDMSYAEAVGVLHIKAADLVSEAREEDDED